MLLIILFTLISLNFYKATSNDVINVITRSDNNFKLEKIIEKGTKVKKYTYEADCHIYKNADKNISVFIYDYATETEVTNKIRLLYENGKKGTIPIEYTEENNYILKKSCTTDLCTKVLAHDNYLTFFYYENNSKLEKKVNNIIEKII